jgi:hypothetical protein
VGELQPRVIVLAVRINVIVSVVVQAESICFDVNLDGERLAKSGWSVPE